MSRIDSNLVGRKLVGVDGHKIGRVDAIYVNSATAEPEWVVIGLGGILSAKHGFAPVSKVHLEGESAVVDYDRQYVKDAPTSRSEGVLSPDENEALYDYYGMPHPQEPSSSRDATLGPD
jgi:hypothetical protein